MTAFVGEFGPREPVSTAVDSRVAVQRINDENGVDQSDGDRSAAAELNFDTFLQLLSTQLQYQDPLNPMEDTEWTTQLAQYSTLEAQLESNELLEKLAAAENLSQEALAISYIGKEALVRGEVTATSGQNSVSLNYKQDTQSYKTTIEIREIVEQRNADGDLVQVPGDVVRRLEGTTFEGRNEVVWDSKDDNGNPVEAGFYTFNVSAVNSEGDGIFSEEYTYARVRAVESSQDGEDMIVTMNDGRVSLLNDVLLVREAGQQAAAPAPGNDDSTDSTDSADSTEPAEEEDQQQAS